MCLSLTIISLTPQTDLDDWIRILLNAGNRPSTGFVLVTWLCLLSSSSVGSVYALLVCDANQEDLAIFCSSDPSGGQAVSGPTGDHRLHQQVLYDLHWLGGYLLPGLELASTIQSCQNRLPRAGSGERPS